MKPLRNGEITLPFIDVGDLCTSHEFEHRKHVLGSAVAQW